MKLSIFATAIALASTALSAPTNGCVSMKQAKTIISRYTGIITHQGSDLGTAQQTAEQLLVRGYEEISDSILSLEQQPLGGATFTSRTDYINAVLNAPPVGGVETLGVYVAGCNKVLWQWNFQGVGIAENEVKGFSLMTVNRKGQLVKTELEFNSVAWGQDTFQLPCSSPTSSSSSSASSAPATQKSGTPPAASAPPTASSPPTS